MPGGNSELFAQGTAGVPYPAQDGKTIYYSRGENIWAVSMDDKIERPVTAFQGRYGRLGFHALATDGRYLYFGWRQDTGDLWGMDVEWE